MNNENELRISNITTGRITEGLHVGKNTTFIHLTGSNIEPKNSEAIPATGKLTSVDEILEEIKSRKAKTICFTGGEPFIQKNAIKFISKKLKKRFLEVILKTNGTISWKEVGLPEAVSVNVTLQAPSTNCTEFNDYELLKDLTKKDELNFVIIDKRDFKWATSVLDLHKPEITTNVFLLPNGLFGRMIHKWADGDNRVRVMIRNGG